MQVHLAVYFTKYKSNSILAFYETVVLEIVVKTQEYTRDGGLC